MRKINYRAVHTKTLWRKVSSHQSLDAAINGKDGASGLFAGKARINYGTHGDARYVIVWEQGASTGWVLRPAIGAPTRLERAEIPVADIQSYEDRGQASMSELERHFKLPS